MDTLLELAGIGGGLSTPDEGEGEEIDQMDVESLVKMTLEDDEVLESLGSGAEL